MVGASAMLARHQTALGSVLYAALALIVCVGVWRTPASAAIGHPLDTPHVLWFLRWYPFAIAHAQPLLVSDYIGYPGGVNLMWNNSIPRLSIILSPRSWLCGGTHGGRRRLWSGVRSSASRRT